MYLALLGQSFFGLLPEEIKPAALLCNNVVVTGGVIIFYKEKMISLRDCWPFLLFSVPMAFLGGYWRTDQKSFFVLLGITLVTAAFFLWIQPEKMRNSDPMKSNAIKSVVGGGIGFVSGLVGIGGGIFLSPLLHFIRWAEARRRRL